MVPLLAFLEVIFLELTAAKAAAAIGVAAVTGASLLENKAHRYNAKTGRNPILDEQATRAERRRLEAEGLPTEFLDMQRFSLFRLPKEGLLSDEHEDLARWWFLTSDEEDQLRQMAVRDALNADPKRPKPPTKLLLELQGIQNKLEYDDAEFVGLLGGGAPMNFERMKAISDNRLMSPLFTHAYLKGLEASVSKEELAEEQEQMKKARAEAEARQNSLA